ncbi:cold shock domain-containing protein [Methylocystis sp. IM2]|uniref:cold shock domain-containing protein n=1 Tax=unclassified Methylocystis TaxID=2625913 RepID=UPI0040485F04
MQDQVGRKRGKIEHHEESPIGVVGKLAREDGYGVLEMEEGHEIYFHCDGVSWPGFDSLEPGVRVKFVKEEGAEGRRRQAV